MGEGVIKKIDKLIEGEALIDLSELPEDEAKNVCTQLLGGTYIERGQRCIVKVELKEDEDYKYVLRIKELISHDGEKREVREI